MKKLLALLFALVCLAVISTPAQQVLTISPSGLVVAAIDQNGWHNFKVVLTQNVAAFQFQGFPTPAQGNVTVIFTQDGVGGRTVTFIPWVSPSGQVVSVSNACTPNSVASTTTVCALDFDTTTSTWIGVVGTGPQGAPGPPGGQGPPGSANPGGSDTQLQINKTNTAFTGNSCLNVDSSTSPTTLLDCLIFQQNADSQFLGPNPDVDIRSKGAVSGSIHTTGTGSGTSLTVGVTTFKNTYGITIAGGGPAASVGVPSAPTVTPGEAESETEPDSLMTAGVSGSSTYKYCVLVEDIAGGLPGCGPTTTITTGPATLGKNTVTLSAISLTGQTLSFTSSSAHGLVQYALAHITAGSNSYFLSGWFPIQTITDATHAGATQTVENAGASTVTAASGTLVYFVGINLTWTGGTGTPYRQYICVQRPGDGAFHIVGQALPGENQYVDFGFNLNQFLPWWISDANCTSGAQSQLSVNTVSGGGGTANLTLGTALGTAVTGAAVRLDNEIALLNGGTAGHNNSAARVSSGSYELNSPLQVPFGASYINVGTIVANAPIIVNNSSVFGGLNYRGWNGLQQFASSAPALVTCNANPCFDLFHNQTQGAVLDSLTLIGNDNGLLVAMAANFTNSYKNLQMYTNVDNNDVMGIAMWGGPSGVNSVPPTTECFDCVFVGGPAQTIDSIWSSLLYMEGGVSGPGAGFTLHNPLFSRRSIFFRQTGGNGAILNVNEGYYCQGCITPSFAFENNSGNVVPRFTMTGTVNDTNSQALLALWGAGGGTIQAVYSLGSVNSPQSDGGGNPALVTGSGFNGTEFIGERLGDTGPNGIGIPGVGFKFDGISLFATNNLSPISDLTLNLGDASHRWLTHYLNTLQLYGSITGANTFYLSGPEGVCTSPVAGKDIMCAGSSSFHSYAESDNGGPLEPLVKTPGVFDILPVVSSTMTTAQFAALLTNCNPCTTAAGSVTAGQTLVGVAQAIVGTTNAVTFTDSQSDAWARVMSWGSGITGNDDIEIWVAPCVPANASLTVTSTPSSSQNRFVYVWKVSNAACAQPVDTPSISLTSCASGTSCTSNPAFPIITSNEAVLASVWPFAGPGACTSVSSGYTLNQAINGYCNSSGVLSTAAPSGTTTTFNWPPSSGALQYSVALRASPVIGASATPWSAYLQVAEAQVFATATNCAAIGTAASPSVASCGSAAAGEFSCATNASGATCQVNTTAVDASSEVSVFEMDIPTVGTRLGVTCNTTTNVLPASRLIASITPGTGFTINLGTVTTNPACFGYTVTNQ